jgi:hypothetical protein
VFTLVKIAARGRASIFAFQGGALERVSLIPTLHPLTPNS